MLYKPMLKNSKN